MGESAEIIFREGIHAPSHLFVPSAAYMVTAGTFRKASLFDTDAKRDFLLETLLDQAEQWGWNLQAWAIMPNHYHFVAYAPEDALTLRSMIKALHSKAAVWLNKSDGVIGRKVWFQYWDTCLTYESSFLARMNYVHNNPVKHGFVERAEDYRWCSMGWFRQKADAKWALQVLSRDYSRVNVADDF